MARRKKRLQKKTDYNFIAVLIGIIIIVMVAISTSNGYISENIKCKHVRGHLCTKYEVEKYIEGK